MNKKNWLLLNALLLVTVMAAAQSKSDTVIENKKMNNYITYIAVINQFIFERIEGPANSE